MKFLVDEGQEADSQGHPVIRLKPYAITKRPLQAVEESKKRPHIIHRGEQDLLPGNCHQKCFPSIPQHSVVAALGLHKAPEQDPAHDLDVKVRHARRKSNPTNISTATIVCDGVVGDSHLPIDPGSLNCKSGSSGFAAPFKNFRPLGTPGWSSHRMKKHYRQNC